MERSSVSPALIRSDGHPSTGPMALPADPKTILNSISDGFFVLDSAGYIVYLNATAEKQLGLSRDVLLGHVLWDLIPDARASLLFREVGRAIASGRRSNFETRFPSEKRTIEIHLYPDAKGGVSVYFRDVTDRRQLADEIRQRDAFYRLLVENTMEYAIFGLDFDGNITHWNEGAQKLLGYSEEEIRGQHGSVVYTLEDLQSGAFAREFEVARETGRAENERWHIRKDGSRFWGSGFLIALKDDGELRGYVKIMRDNTERERVEGTLRQYQDIFQFSQQGIAIGNPDSETLIQTNPAFAQMHGFTVEQMVDMPVLDLFPERERATAMSILAEAEQTGHARIETTHLRKDGSEFPIFLDITAVRDESGNVLYRIVNAVDITDRKRTEQSLRESEERFRILADAAPDFIWISNTVLERYYLNRPWVEFTGRSMESEVGHGWESGVHPDDISRVRDVLKYTLEQCIPFQIQYRLRRHDGEYRWILDKGQPRHTPDGAFLGFIGSCIDITDQKRLLHREKAARKQAEEASRAKDEFLATVSHELRTPLNAILGWSSLLKEGILGEEDSARALETIERNARAQAQIVEDILDIARVITGKMSLQFQAMDLVTIASASLEAVRPSAEAKSIALDVNLPEHADISGDATRLGQAILNLLTNAIKFTPANGQVRLNLTLKEGNWELEVSDSGVGIKPDFLPHVFDRFRQADASSTRLHGGLGLGLALVRYIVEAHGGTVSASSPGEGQGATFIAMLPAFSEATSHQAGKEHVATSENQFLVDKTILVIDDAADTLEFVKLLLERAGVNVGTAASVAEAKTELQRRTFDAIICDLGMPEEDGFALAAWVQGHEKAAIRSLPMLALTAFAGPDMPQRTQEAGFRFYLAKPFESQDLLNTVCEIFR